MEKRVRSRCGALSEAVSPGSEDIDSEQNCYSNLQIQPSIRQWETCLLRGTFLATAAFLNPTLICLCSAHTCAIWRCWAQTGTSITGINACWMDQPCGLLWSAIHRLFSHQTGGADWRNGAYGSSVACKSYGLKSGFAELSANPDIAIFSETQAYCRSDLFKFSNSHGLDYRWSYHWKWTNFPGFKDDMSNASQLLSTYVDQCLS